MVVGLTCHLHSSVPSEPENCSLIATISVSSSAAIDSPQLPVVAPVEGHKVPARHSWARSRSRSGLRVRLTFTNPIPSPQKCTALLEFRKLDIHWDILIGARMTTR